MQVKDLIQQLQQFDEGDEVHISYNYGDHWRTQVAPKIKRIQMLEVKHSDYHRMPAVVGDEEDGDDDPQMVVVLS